MKGKYSKNFNFSVKSLENSPKFELTENRANYILYLLGPLLLFVYINSGVGIKRKMSIFVDDTCHSSLSRIILRFFFN